jgi:arylsulfatase A-like enzyme
MSRSARLTLLLALLTPSGGALMAADTRQAQHPNIVIMLTDNLGWGEIGIHGSARGVPTPRLDRLAAQGIRLTNFNVEYSCVVSRAALLTGRYAVRTGAAQRSGITLWEVTMA